jgi:putative hydrolase of the HAD superfamily
VRRKPLDLERTLLLEDSVPVLTAARGFGLSRTIAIRRPDSQQPARAIEGFAAVDGVVDLI